MKIGIFGGSFNPPHNMHKKIAIQLIKLGMVDKVIFVPTGNRYLKSDLADATDRYQMLEIFCKNEKLLEVSDFEVRNHLIYTYQTLDYFQRIYPNDQIFFIMGADNLAELSTWKNYEYLLEKYSILVIKRDGEDIGGLLQKYHYHKNILVMNIDRNDISSTKIRALIKMNPHEIYDYLDEKVIDYIIKKRLYMIEW